MLTIKLGRITSRSKLNKVQNTALMKSIYRCINDCIVQNNHTEAYQAVDLLKLALGERLARSNESMRLMALAVAALRTKQPDIASHILEAYKPLIRNLSDDERVVAIEQLTLIAMVALKARYNFMIPKVADTIFTIIEQQDKRLEKKIILAGLRGLKIIGVMALRRHDEALFREISLRIGNLHYIDEDIAKAVVGVLNEWLHRAIKQEDQVMFLLVLQLCLHYIDKNELSDDIYDLIVVEWQNLAGTAALNPRSRMAAETIDFLLMIAEKRFNAAFWTLVVSAAAKTGRLAVSQHDDIEISFSTLYPLLDAGRRMLSAELKFHKSSDGLRQKILFLIARECVMIASLIARKDMTSSTGEVLSKLYDCWINDPQVRGSQKSIKKFCQFLMLYWMKYRHRQSRRGFLDQGAITEPSLLTDAEKERFSLT
ncbi:hypothetical protein HA075_01875 [bacterium BFN5]|nr:hypothetical protein HA075_01510 [bacterium BFN5]QJW44697.1 hypothetical protein HA075_01875 [bacterium BFN5]